MKIKELQKTVNVAWSPAQQDSILLAAGTAAQQLDASTTATLEIYATNLSEPGYDLVLKGSQTSPYRFHKLVWSPHGCGGNYPNGVIVGGCEGGHLVVHNAAKLLNGDESLIVKQDKHNGAVRAIDFNPFQSNLLATGASESEILIWDLNNTTTPMNPGTKTQPYEDVQNVGWNKQVQHILASVFSSRCVIWDLRKNEPIIKLSDSQSRVRWRALQWHPDVATQLWLASEEDMAPVVQLWDLRYATSPAKSLQIHHRGVLGLSWCPKDTDLMISCGKDNKIICWNPNTEIAGDEILSEVASTVQWYSDVQWCPRNPAIIASSSLDGIVSIYSLMGGVQQQVQTTRKIADSFPGMETMSEAMIPQNHTAAVSYSDLKKPPKWMRRPIGAVFGFGGKLISFTNNNGKLVNLKQIITEPEFVERSTKLENVLVNGNYKEYCSEKCVELQDDEDKRYIWQIIDSYFQGNTQADMVKLLGYNSEEVQNKLLNWYYANYKEDDVKKELSRGTENASLFDGIPSDGKLLDGVLKATSTTDGNYKIRTGDDDDDGMICQALLTGQIEMAVNLCMNAGRYADAIIIAMTGGSELLARTQHQYLKKRDGYLANLISALVTKDWSTVVTQCTTDSWKDALVAIITHSGAEMPALCECLAERLILDGDRKSIENAILCYLFAGNVEKVVDTWQRSKLLNADASNENGTQDLQELVEVSILLQKAVEQQGRNVGASGKFADLLAKYASLLSAQGALNTALTYLMPSDDPEMTDLRERLFYALGHKQAYQVRQSLPQNVYNKQSTAGAANRFSQQRHSVPNNLQNAPQNTFGNVYQPPVVQQQPHFVPSSATAIPHPQQQLPQQQQQQPWNTQATQPPPAQSWNTVPFNPAMTASVAAPASTIPPPVGPPPPSSAAAAPTADQLARPPSVGAQGLPRSKYLLDPSVQSGSGYGQTSNLYTPQTFNQPAFNNSQPQPTFPGMAMPSQQPSMAAPSFNQNQFVPFTPAPVANSYLSGVPPLEVAQPALPPQSIMSSGNAPPGWNDPPPLKSRPKAKTPVLSSAPTLYGQDGALANGILNPTVSQAYNAPSMMTPSVPQPMQYAQPQQLAYQQPHQAQPPQTFMPGYQQQQQQQQQLPQQQQQIPASFNPQQQQQQLPTTPFQPNAIQSTNQAPIKTPTPEPIVQQKAPIPEEYVYMQTVFNELRIQCIGAALNAQTKRKLEDVAKRLESLYDLLRENRLTPNTLTALVQLVQYIQNGDYANGMNLHTQMVSGPDFAQIASFMPGIKVLLQSALQLQVYLR